MTNTSYVLARRIYNVAVSVSIIAAGACFITGCLSIYYGGGDEPYSRQIVAETFRSIAISVFTCLALTLGGFVWELISPAPVQTSKPPKDYPFLIARLASKKDLTSDTNAQLALRREHNRRLSHTVIRTALTLVGMIVFGVYCMHTGHFTDNINASVIRAMWIALPCFAIPFGYAVFTAFYNAKSYERELNILKSLPASSSEPTAVTTPQDKHLLWIRIALLVLAVGCTVYGLLAGGTVDVLTKAINICTECIGLG